MGDLVDDEVTEDQRPGHRCGGGPGAGSAQHRMDPGDQLPDAKRFGDVVICPRGQAGDFVLLRPSGGEHEDVAVGEGTNPPADLKAVYFRQSEIQDHDIRVESSGIIDCLDSGMSFGGVETGPGEIGGYHLCQGFLIVDDQDPASGAILRWCSGGHRHQYPPSRWVQRWSWPLLEGNLHQIFNKHRGIRTLTPQPYGGWAPSKHTVSGWLPAETSPGWDRNTELIDDPFPAGCSYRGDRGH